MIFISLLFTFTVLPNMKAPQHKFILVWLVLVVLICSILESSAEEKKSNDASGDPDSDDYYKVLGVPRNADQKTIKSAYRRMALRYHPDKAKKDNIDAKEAQNRFVKIGRAYEVLNNPRNRQIYDQYGTEGVNNMGNDGGEGEFPFEFPFGGGGGAEDMHFSFSDPFELFKNMFQGGDGSPFSFGGPMGDGDSGFTITFGDGVIGGGDFFGFGDSDDGDGFDIGSIFGFGEPGPSHGERIESKSGRKRRRGPGKTCTTSRHCNQFGCETVQHCE